MAEFHLGAAVSGWHADLLSHFLGHLNRTDLLSRPDLLFSKSEEVQSGFYGYYKRNVCIISAY